MRAASHVPRIDVPAQNHHFFGMLAPGNLADHVARIRIRFHVRGHLQMNLHGHLILRKSRQHHGIFKRYRRRRNLRLRFVVNHGAGVRNLHRQRRDRPHQHRHRPQRRGPRSSIGAIHDRLPIALVNFVVNHNFSTYASAAQFRELIEVVHDDRIGRDPARWSPDAHPQAQHMQRPGLRREQPGRFGSAHPMRNFHRNRAHVAQTVALHLLFAPLDRARQRFRAAQPVPDRGRTGRQASRTRRYRRAMRRSADWPPPCNAQPGFGPPQTRIPRATARTIRVLIRGFY